MWLERGAVEGGRWLRVAEEPHNFTVYFIADVRWVDLSKKRKKGAGFGPVTELMDSPGLLQ